MERAAHSYRVEGAPRERGPHRLGRSSIMPAVDGTAFARAPLRISLGGGGTDLPSHYREHGGFVVSVAIDLHVRVRVATAPGPRFRLQHLEVEEVDDPRLIRHPILRAAIARHWDGRPLELASEGDVAPGTGLGSSGAYTVAAVKALELAAGRDLVGDPLAEAACSIEIYDLERTVGKQDQYAAALGGANTLTFDRDGTVLVRRLSLGRTTLDALRERFVLFFSGESRSAAGVLAGQVERTLAGDSELARNLRRSEDVAREGARALEAGDLDSLGPLMNEQWQLKLERLAQVPSPRIERLRDLALGAGATGVMLMGAGGGGHLLAYAPEPERVRAALIGAGAPEVPFDVDTDGCVGWRGQSPMRE
jgi:D-glycero-alpha-D-manno-heptose-7-phosphate kinase